MVKARSPSPFSTPVRPINLSERMSQLKSSQTSWKNRVEESDAQLFTVAGKLSKSGELKICERLFFIFFPSDNKYYFFV